ncbi:YqiA/YcfP family alpha/beta fold hydrolase [Pontibacter sp. G13]|uniref:YqiA/YcfP family alpha/beta fold hydrolase n=1 Tax=Pontibacter sp. G13 TaxID=3074898 RepID=UPI00288B9E86|nr:YqiA/YcfP family alpha/beta fold hydrolase [Pontibacter sp. G13]WNJ18848.1 YqiA/YcfP family alpha/beta fold hydrolase [Pontibacter sp. G13]
MTQITYVSVEFKYSDLLERILYIHGLDSSPNPERIQILESMGHSVEALHLDYRNEPNSYGILKAFALESEISFLVGSSLGGMIGYWLGRELGMGSVLFNPAIWIPRQQAGIPLEISGHAPNRTVIIGAEDEVVDPQLSWEHFRNDQSAPLQQVVLWQGLGHQIDVDTFESAVWQCRHLRPVADSHLS